MQKNWTIVWKSDSFVRQQLHFSFSFCKLYQTVLFFLMAYLRCYQFFFINSFANDYSENDSPTLLTKIHLHFESFLLKKKLSCIHAVLLGNDFLKNWFIRSWTISLFMLFLETISNHFIFQKLTHLRSRQFYEFLQNDSLTLEKNF